MIYVKNKNGLSWQCVYVDEIYYCMSGNNKVVKFFKGNATNHLIFTIKLNEIEKIFYDQPDFDHIISDIKTELAYQNGELIH